MAKAHVEQTGKSIRSATVKKAKTRSRRTQKSSTPSASVKGLPWTFPKYSLEDALVMAKSIEEKNAGNPMRAADLAVAAGYKQSSDWRFLELLRSANQYGIVNGTGAAATVSLTKLGQDIVSPASPIQRVEGLRSAFRTAKDFEAVENFYGGKRIPEDEFFLNTLNREFNIPRERVDAFADTFLKNLRFLRSFSSRKDSDKSTEDSTSSEKLTPKLDDPVTGKKIQRTREFLDTCFVMMPFGEWFDRYYQEIYIPAIREAGFEPVRADELFSTGSVVEQIWDQISKAKLLLADLSGKNPNVFYELGLAHAACKPVVFTASAIDDVPFDLRHLRVITYEIREPNWSEKLKRAITDYLKNAAREPAKSIPHPFRSMLEVEAQNKSEESS